MSAEPAELLCYLPEFKVIVCTSCRYALQPRAISRHLKDIHHILRSHRKPFLQYTSTFDLDDPEAVKFSTHHLKEFPVPLLPVEQGLRCTHQGCSHLCITEKRMRSHWALKHNRTGRAESDWSSAPLQTFFKGNALRYFTKPSVSSVLNYPISKELQVGEQETSLLQHYVASTSLTLADGVETWAQVSIWQEVIPQLAAKSPFLMHGILACSALHLAYLNASERQGYLMTAAMHQELAIPLFRKAVSSTNAENCHAILAFVHIIAICSFASDQDNERLLIVDSDGSDVVSRWLYFLRSGCDYIHTVKDLIKQGPLAALLCELMKPMGMFEDTQMPLEKQLLGVLPTRDAEDAWSDRECQIYREAAHELALAFMRTDRLGKEFNIWHALRAWPMRLSHEYFQLLHDLHAGALIALAYYCILLHKLEENWYMKGKAKRLSRHIVERLDSKWHPHVQLRIE